MQPTVLVDVRPEFSVVREEIFGRSSSPSPSRPPTASTVSSRRPTTPSTAWLPGCGPATSPVNTYNAFDTALPFGGYKQAGWGRELGESVIIDLYTQVKAVNVQR
ncbi:aldehyde dehydrogenase family protein [Streptomyces ipomoeae]|uniref:aldehyde dehydrogenase family protein n=1 Tax=Streptomyces ipomoeae TaxID=103232 RepID=UPI00215B969C|nr:aldehyde dehydrogenase family protein [Streptomyces ipomoeae]MDX2697071.1 aldehyde dehydrogenase family protein [Streptomyces ipomoeae]MDX2824549.1 aldehyde dehydrogenase family protein [Streptomyces ipomoeae]MDX2840203.1 aldehyde dehydrogenase family protein [Streptomyces ipomoeae]MDX2873578.1 aldehyde dehydrogenase family protein [Streptomyces ipomoeae]